MPWLTCGNLWYYSLFHLANRNPSADGRPFKHLAPSLENVCLGRLVRGEKGPRYHVSEDVAPRSSPPACGSAQHFTALTGCRSRPPSRLGQYRGLCALAVVESCARPVHPPLRPQTQQLASSFNQRPNRAPSLKLLLAAATWTRCRRPTDCLAYLPRRAVIIGGLSNRVRRISSPRIAFIDE